MNIWDHSRLSVRKFGGVETDYYSVHKFIDSSKLFYFNAKHRLLLHNLFGIEIAVSRFGDTIINSNKDVILIRDIVAEHLKEDLSGKVPSLNEWLIDNDAQLSKLLTIPKIENKDLEAFVYRPMLMSNLKSSLLITMSDFGIYLTNEILGLEYAKELMTYIEPERTIKNYLQEFKFTARWQCSPDQMELLWLKNQNNEKRAKA